MSTEFAELIEYLDEKFVGVDKRHSSFETHFRAIDNRLDRIETSLGEKASASDMRQVLEMLDGLAKSQEISDDKRLVMGHQLDRLDRWTRELAHKIGHKLSS